MKSLLSINYIFWLILSALFFAVGEYFSKKFSINPRPGTVGLILCAYALGTFAWLPAILQKNQLSIVGVIWSVMSLMATVLIGVIIFSEKLNLIGMLGILTAIISILLLSHG
jgi:multidrug transporter EmrE-like cation transporter